MGRGGARRGGARRVNRSGLGRSVSQFQLQRLDIAPVYRPPIDTIYRQQTQRRDFYQDLGGEVGNAITRIGEAFEAPPTPVPHDLGPGVSYEHTRQLFAELMAVLDEVSKDSDPLTRTVAVVNIDEKLEYNEDLMIQMLRDPAEAEALEAIIVRQEFVEAVMGRRQATMSSLDGQREQQDAYRATGVRVPDPALLGPFEVTQMFEKLRCMVPSAADAASGR